MSISLEEFMRMRETAQNRLAEPHTRAQASKADVPAWKQILEAKRSEIYGNQTTVQAPAIPLRSVEPVRIPKGSLDLDQTRDLAQKLRMQMQQGLPVRSVGNFIDMRA